MLDKGWPILCVKQELLITFPTAIVDGGFVSSTSSKTFITEIEAMNTLNHFSSLNVHYPSI